MSIPITNLPSLYHNGCAFAWASNTTLTIATGQVRDSTNTYDIVVGSTLTINAAANGVNGLDTGSLAASTPYYVFVIFDPTNTNPPAGLISTSGSAPVMPSLNGVTYGAFRLVGCVFTDGSTHFRKVYVDKGNDNIVTVQYDNPVTIVNAGTAGSANVDLSSVVPTQNFGIVEFESYYTPHAAGEYVSFNPVNASANTYTFNGIVASVSQSNNFEILPNLSSGVPKISYGLSVTTSPAALTLKVVGFCMHL